MSDDRPDDPRSLPFGSRLRLAFREDPTKGLVVLALFLFGLAFLVAFFVAFWPEISSGVAEALRSLLG